MKKNSLKISALIALVFVQAILPFSISASTLYVDFSANPSSGSAPLNDVDLTANVSGSATGDITYKFDCTNDGNWEKTITTSNTSYTATDLCDYYSSGTYTAKVSVERGGLVFEGTTAVFVQSSSDLSVNFSANPSSGSAPLNDVDLTANVSGSATGDITYKFDCTNDGNWEKTITTSNTSYTATDLCDYYSSGTYTAKVSVERGGLVFVGTAAISVQSESSDLSVGLYANPSSGNAPLYNVDLTANVSGSATGDITYRFDCTNNGSWERTITTSSTNYTASDVCDYYSSGDYTARVRAERGGLSDEATTIVSVDSGSDLSVSLYASPSSGSAPLNDVDLTANVSGSATGDITYRFDCTSDGSWDRVITTGSTSYTAYDLCDYYNSGIYTARVRAERGGLDAEDQENISANGASGNITVNKLVRNLSDGTYLSDSVSADPGELLSFSIAVEASSYTQNVVVRDILPNQISFSGNLKVDGMATWGDIASGLNIGTLNAGQTKTITFDATVAGAGNFIFGTTTLTNTAWASSSGFSGSDMATVSVQRWAVAGATTISTGPTGNIFLDFFLFPLLGACLIVWLFRSKILRFEEWLDERKRRYHIYKSNKDLQIKIAQVKTREFWKNFSR